MVAQPLTSVSSSSGISARAVKLLLGFIGDFLHLCGAALFFLAGGGFGPAGGRLQRADLLGMAGDGFGVVALLGRQPVGLQAGNGERQSQGDGERADQHRNQPRDVSALTAHI